ncbi:MAG: alpha/beta hydrolase [Anaerolineae bacterium]
MTLTEKTFQAGDITLSYDEGDGNGAPMILLHGLTGMRQAWQVNFIPTYGSTWREYAIDLRGHGKSSHARDERHYRIGDYVEDIVSFIKRELDDRPVVVGHSLGAMTAIGVGAALGDGARGVILLDPPLAARELPVSVFPGASWWFNWVYNTISTGPTYEQVVEACRATNPEASDQMLKGMATQIHSLSPGTVKTALDNRIAENFDFGEALDTITCPVLLMYGEFGQSGATRDEDAAFVREHARKLTTVKLPYDDHGFHETHWDETQPHVTAFLEAV